MKTATSVKLSFVQHTLAALVLLCVCMTAFADEGPRSAKPGNELVVGVDYVVPAYIGGAKVRTPETVDTLLAADIAEQLHAALATINADPMKRSPLLAPRKADLMLTAISSTNSSPNPAPLAGNKKPGVPGSSAAATPPDEIVPTGYSAGPMAIMRSDTNIKTWPELKGRTVCVSEGGRYVGTIAAQYGAIEKTFKAPADSLLALRTGACDAAVHDNTILNELIKLPEWKKFSATLPVGPRQSLVFVAPATDLNTVASLKKVAREWKANHHLEQLTKQMARDIAFEVYLDQNIPDCH